MVVTGAAGSIGSKLSRHLASLGRWTLRLIDRDSRGNPEILAADLCALDGRWIREFEGAVAVVHLAGDPYATAGWESVVQNNIDLSLNVLSAVRLYRVPKLVFASSNWVMAGYRFADGPITPELPPRPINPYGSAKLFIERAGLQLAREAAVAFIALRIGYCQHAQGNVPGPFMEMGTWGQAMWLSDRDLCHGFERALEAEVTGGVVLNLMSDNAGMRWDLSQTRNVLGYTPHDSHTPVATEVIRAAESLARRAAGLSEAMGDLLPPSRF